MNLAAQNKIEMSWFSVSLDNDWSFLFSWFELILLLFELLSCVVPVLSEIYPFSLEIFATVFKQIFEMIIFLLKHHIHYRFLQLRL